MTVLAAPIFGPYPAGTVLAFYETGTLVLGTIYENDTLSPSGELANPLTIGAPGVGNPIGGYAPPIFYDPTLVKLRLQVTWPGQSTPALDIDPVNEFLLITGDQIAPGAIVDNLGYTPANVAGQVFTGNTGANFTPTEINNTDFGFALRAPNIKDTAYTIALSDNNRTVKKDDTSTGDIWTIPPNSLVPIPPGFWFRVRLTNTGTVSVVRGAGVTLRLATSGTSQDVTLAEWCDVIFSCDAIDEWVATGVGAT